MTWWHYLLLVNLYLALFWGFYKALLLRETFFQLNRVYLIASSLLSFIIPLVQSEWLRRLFITQRVHQTIYAAVNPQLIYQVKAGENTVITLGNIFIAIYIAGAAILSIRLIFQLSLLKKLGHHAQDAPAFSFFKKIHVSEELANRHTIFEHEKVHTRQWHSADVLFIEMVMIINWFNPVVYLYRRAIKHVHEFIADRKAIEAGTPTADYALMLLSQSFGVDAHQLTSNFLNHSLLKERIMMLNQDDSKRRALLKYGLSAPLFAIMLIFSAATINHSKLIGVINKKTEQAFSINARQIGHQISGGESTVSIAGSSISKQALRSSKGILKTKGLIVINPDFQHGQTKPGQSQTTQVQSVIQEVEREGSQNGIQTLTVAGGQPAEARVAPASDTVPARFKTSSQKVMTYKARRDSLNTGGAARQYVSAEVISSHEPIILLDGKPLTKAEMNSIKPENIENICVFKGESARQFGENAIQNGAIIIRTKGLKNL
ncbi:peptidase M56 BlaR1 [Mucilaginibacter paludis DSM 18603]|uniref:Peptidase M56 BlaR1 n=2 Tax=Mucilaginibacter TaxID=423349 RepID=H1YIF4_9SPHI|nr:peptidase M56 BlaR1 [Mucilaginibacter paludis DSM 18603]